MTVAGVILAGGQSRRMGGGDKSLLSIAGSTMLQRVVDRLRPQVGELALNANGDLSRFSGIGLPIITDPIDGFAGPLAGVLSGMHWAASLGPSPTHIVTVASDTPFFPTNLVAGFRDVNEGATDRIVLARSNGNRHPVFGFWPVALRNDLAKFMANTDTLKVMAFANHHDLRFADFPLIEINGLEVDPFFNANTPDDIETAERIATETIS
ncbi:MAG: molybdenum cofactor guanylyltransferase MobA [Rhizobiaceae bacterium]